MIHKQLVHHIHLHRAAFLIIATARRGFGAVTSAPASRLRVSSSIHVCGPFPFLIGGDILEAHQHLNTPTSQVPTRDLASIHGYSTGSTRWSPRSQPRCLRRGCLRRTSESPDCRRGYSCKDAQAALHRRLSVLLCTSCAPIGARTLHR